MYTCIQDKFGEEYLYEVSGPYSGIFFVFHLHPVLVVRPENP